MAELTGNELLTNDVLVKQIEKRLKELQEDKPDYDYKKGLVDGQIIVYQQMLRDLQSIKVLSGCDKEEETK